MFLELQGSLSLGPGKHCDADQSPLTGGSYPFSLVSGNLSVSAVAGLFEQTVDSEGAFQALPFPPNMLATVTYIAPLKGATFEVRYTFADDSTVILPQTGMSLIEHDPDNAVTGIELKGSGKLRWLAAGELA